MRTIKRPRRQSLIASHWPALVAFIVALNLVWVARTVINRIPHGGIKVVNTSGESKAANEHINTNATESSTISKVGGGGSTTNQKGERTCRTEWNADYDGDEAIVYGDAHKTESSTECCNACIANPKCNVWVWNGEQGGPAYQECWLKRSSKLNPANPEGRRSPVLGWSLVPSRQKRNTPRRWLK